MRVLYAYLCLLLSGVVSTLGNTGVCVDINTAEIESRLNVSYDNNCYSHTKSKYECCSHFLLDDRCIDSYKDCVQYKDYILDGIKDNCNGHQERLFNLTYSDKCHDFTLELEPKCCDNMSLPECSEWYSECHLHHHGEVHNKSTCSIPTKYTNRYCGDYVKHIDDNCCIDFNENCVGIYKWCLENSPNETSLLDLFLGPRIGYIMGNSHKVYNNIGILELCAALCLRTLSCQSINYIEDYGQCHLNSRVRGDPGVEFIDDSDSVYYSKIYKMPIHNTLCNVRYDYWIADGMCDKTGGYNTEECHYDGGDCCKETCIPKNIFECVGVRDFECKDPLILNPTTISETSRTQTYSNQTTSTQTPITNSTQTPITNSTQTPITNSTQTPITTSTQTPITTSTTPITNSTTSIQTLTTSTQPTITTSTETPIITQTLTTGGTHYNSTGNEPITDKLISKDTYKVRTRNILLGVFIFILLVGGVVLYFYIINKRIRENGNTVNINDPYLIKTSFDNPVYNDQYLEETSELYREVDTDTQYSDLDVNDRNNDISPDKEEV